MSKKFDLEFDHSIVVKGQFTALHRWPEAPKQVEFLRNWHRHIFKVEVFFEVNHNNRDLEFFLVQSDLYKVLLKWEGKKINKSCEMFAEAIAYALYPKYPSLRAIKVSEDGENGSVTHIRKAEDALLR